MQINSCKTCGMLPKLITHSAIQYDDIVDGVITEQHFHPIPMTYIECDCGPTLWHPLEARQTLVDGWNAKNPAPVVTYEYPELPIANKG